MEKRSNIQNNMINFALGNKTFLIALLMVIILSFCSPRFLTASNLINVLRQICTTGILAMPFTFIIASGHIDLSAGSIVGFCGIVISLIMRDAGIPLIPALLITMCVGMALEGINAIVISELKLPPFIVTLAMQSIVRGMVYILSGMAPVNRLPESLINMGQGYLWKIPVPIIVLFAVTMVLWFLAKRTRFGRYVVAMGGNQQATYYSGINIKKIRLLVYMLMGACIAIAAAVLTGRTASGQVAAGVGMETDCITAVVIGGSAFTGGLMNIAGTFFGCLIVGLISNGMNLIGIDTNYQIIAKGLMILIALIIDNVSTSLYLKIKKNTGK